MIGWFVSGIAPMGCNRSGSKHFECRPEILVAIGIPSLALGISEKGPSQLPLGITEKDSRIEFVLRRPLATRGTRHVRDE